MANKVDVRKLEELRPDERALLDGMVQEARKISNGGEEEEDRTSGGRGRPRGSGGRGGTWAV